MGLATRLGRRSWTSPSKLGTVARTVPPLLLLVVLAACAGHPEADAIYYGGVIRTVDPDRGVAEALAVRDGRILAVGASKDLRARHEGPSTRLVDLGGACVVPGLIDSHGHLSGLGGLRNRLDLRGVASFAAVVQKVASRAGSTPAGEWIVGRGWDHSLWGTKKLPTHADLSRAVPDHPVLLTRVDGHAALANAAALARSGITGTTVSPMGGEILHDEAGRPTGMLIDNAIGLVSRHVSGASRGTLMERWRTGQEACFRVGLTSVHVAGVSRRALPEIRAHYASGTLKLRVHAMLSDERGLIPYLRANDPAPDERFAVRAVKLYIDGAMGSRGAWLLEDYSDRPGHCGLSVTEPGHIRAVALAAMARGWQVCTHAIGDRGNREVLDAYADALASTPERDHRFRVEHAQCISPHDIPRFAELGVIASMQPTHATTDMRWAEDRLGTERLAGSYAWRRILDSGARLAFGSDFPVESENPLRGIYAAVTRQNENGQPAGGWLPDQRVTVETALRLFTLDAAYAAFRENDLGSLTPGKLADFTILDKDLISIPAREILETRVLLTVIGGEVVFRATGGSLRETTAR